LSDTFQQIAEGLVCGSTANHRLESSLAGAEEPAFLADPWILHAPSDQFFLPLLWPRFAQALQSQFEAGEFEADTSGWRPREDIARWSREVLRGLFRATPEAAALVRAESERLFGGLDGAGSGTLRLQPRWVVGLHIRTRMYDFEDATVPSLNVEDFFDCAEALLREADEQDVKDENMEDGGAGKAVVFLATPSEEVKAMALLRFGERLRTRQGIEVDRLSGLGELDAFVDLALLALCDELIVSVHSTFGAVAHSLAGVDPWVISEGQGRSLVQGRCHRRATTAPCFHVGEQVFPNLSCAQDLRTSLAVQTFGEPCWF